MDSFLNGKVTLLRGDCLELLPTLEENSIDSVVTDPPYGLQFMGREWDKLWRNETESDKAYVEKTKGKLTSRQRKLPDYSATKPAQMQEFHYLWAKECLRVLKPGAHLLAFSGTRTYHRMACAIEDAGFEIRDQIGWCYGSGFPKSHDVSKGIDRMAGAEREIVGKQRLTGNAGTSTKEKGGTYSAGIRINNTGVEIDLTAPATEAAKEWQGWGTALKPSWESLCLAQKPFKNSQLFDMIGSTIQQLESRLWSMLSANVAEQFFGLSQSEFDAASAFARWSAGERSNTLAGLSAQMATTQFESALISSLNTVSLWKACLTANSHAASMSTTETASSTTIDPKTWKSCLSKTTPESIILAHKSGAWSSANASFAERYLTADAMKWSATQELSAAENALSGEPIFCPDEIARIKPEWASIVLARKPLSESSIAANVLKWGTGAINVDGCRVEGITQSGAGSTGFGSRNDNYELGTGRQYQANGRWPANLIHDGSEEVLAGFPETAPSTKLNCVQRARSPQSKGAERERMRVNEGFSDSGSAARFFYSCKADADDRLGSKHPTVKPLDLMQYLVRLVTPPKGVVLDPFGGTGTTAEAAFREGMNCILIEREPEYQADIVRRMGLCLSGPDERRAASVTQVGHDDLPMFRGVA